MFVHVALRKAYDEIHEIFFLDLAKAFDKVLHEAILRAALQVGIPTPLVTYMECLYNNTKLHLTKTKVECGRGLKQGDPLSPVLFILTMDELVAASCPDIGISPGEHIVDAIMYADNLILLAESPEMMEVKLKGLNGA